MDEDRNKSGCSRAAVVAAVLFVASGIGYRVLAERLARPVESVPLPGEGLSEFPMEVGDWQGQDLPLSEAIIRATDTDDHLSRRYTRHGGTDAVTLFVAYGVRTRDLLPHRPEVCYPGAGWVIHERDAHELEVPGLGTLPCQIYRFSLGGLDTKAVRVLNYYIVDGEYCEDVSLLRSKVWRAAGDQHYMAQVQIAAPEGMLGDDRSAVRAITDFARASAVPLRRMMPDRAGLGGPSPSTTPDPRGSSPGEG